MGLDDLEPKFFGCVDEYMIQFDEDRSAELDRLRGIVVSVNGGGASADERVSFEYRDIQWYSGSV